MALKRNVFTDSLQSFLDGLRDLRYISQLSDSTILRTVKRQQKQLDALPVVTNSAPRFAFGLSTQISFPDFMSDQPYMSRYIYGEKEANNADLIHLTEEVGMRLQGAVWSAVFELTETYLKSIGTRYLFQARTASAEKRLRVRFDKNEFHRTLGKPDSKSRPKPGTLEYYQLYVRTRSRNGCVWLLDEFLRVLPAFNGSEGAGRAARLVGLKDIYRVVEFTRHKIVHQGGSYGIADVKELSLHQRAMVQGITHESRLTEGAVLLVTVDDVRNIVE